VLFSGDAKKRRCGACGRIDGAAVGAARARRETHGAPVLAASALDANAAAAPLRRNLRHSQSRGRPLIRD
jgi:hypothetical protein